MEVLTIDKNTKLWTIKDKTKYTKLILNKDINPTQLEDFINLKELVLNGENTKNKIIEKKYNKRATLNSLEKIVYKNMDDFQYQNLIIPNLKSVELPIDIFDIETTFFAYLYKIEEIKLSSKDKYFCYSSKIVLHSAKVKRIIIEYLEKEYVVDLDYNINTISSMEYNREEDKLIFQVKNTLLSTNIYIDIKTGDINKENICHLWGQRDEVFIPDYITKLESQPSYEIKKISLNTKLLNTETETIVLINSIFSNNLETIEIRNKNEMALMPTKIINVKDYGKLENVYIKDNLLYIDYETCLVTIDENSKLTKTDKLNNNTLESNILNDWSLEELETYASYLRLLKQSNEKEYQDAMHIIEKTLIKKYKTK